MNINANCTDGKLPLQRGIALDILTKNPTRQMLVRSQERDVWFE